MKAKKKPYLLNKYMNVKEFNQMKKVLSLWCKACKAWIQMTFSDQPDGPKGMLLETSS